MIVFCQDETLFSRALSTTGPREQRPANSQSRAPLVHRRKPCPSELPVRIARLFTSPVMPDSCSVPQNSRPTCVSARGLFISCGTTVPYDMVEFREVARYGRAAGVKLGHVDIAKFTEGFGAAGVNITDASKIGPALQEGLASPVPFRWTARKTSRS